MLKRKQLDIALKAAMALPENYCSNKHGSFGALGNGWNNMPRNCATDKRRLLEHKENGNVADMIWKSHLTRVILANAINGRGDGGKIRKIDQDLLAIMAESSAYSCDKAQTISVLNALGGGLARLESGGYRMSLTYSNRASSLSEGDGSFNMSIEMPEKNMELGWAECCMGTLGGKPAIYVFNIVTNDLNARAPNPPGAAMILQEKLAQVFSEFVAVGIGAFMLHPSQGWDTAENPVAFDMHDKYFDFGEASLVNGFKGINDGNSNLIFLSEKNPDLFSRVVSPLKNEMAPVRPA